MRSRDLRSALFVEARPGANHAQEILLGGSPILSFRGQRLRAAVLESCKLIVLDAAAVLAYIREFSTL